MSLASWKKEFYPSEANTIKTRIGAIKHSLRKWVGALPKNLKKHKVELREGRILEPRDYWDAFVFNSDNCALCQLYFDFYLSEGDDHCLKCPLYALLNNTRCYGMVGLGEPDRPFELLYDDNPNPMIALLRKALKVEQKKGAKK